MSCIITPDIAAQYPNTDVALFYSTPMWIDNNGTTQADVANTILGYYQAMERIGQSSTVVPTTSQVENPYSCLLRPLTENSRIYNAPDNGVFLESITFSLYDQMVNGGTQTQLDSALYQDATLNSAVVNSQNTMLNRAMTGTYRFGMVGNWQPNYFRPIVRVNGETILDMNSTFTKPNGQNNLADLSIGASLPLCVEPMKPFAKIKEITIAAFALQIIAQAGARNLQRYGVLCEMKFRTQ